MSGGTVGGDAPAGDVVTISRLQTQFERAPNVIRRYVFSAAPANRLEWAC